jgi:hypothetical protein
MAWPLRCAGQILPPQSKIQNPKSKIQSEPLFWAEGIHQAEQLDLYRKTGLNTVVVQLTWPPSPDGSLEPSDLAPQRAFALAAAARGLNVIYQLPAAPFGMEHQLRMTADSEAYFTVWTLWTQAAIAALSDTPKLLGWMLPDDPRSLPFYEDLGFGRWLAANYANIGVLNRQWRHTFLDFSQVNIAAAQGLALNWRGDAAQDGMTVDALKQRLETSNQRADSENWAFHPAALALASYKWSAYRALLARWAQVVHDAAPGRLVFSGHLPDYAQLLALPPNVDVAVADIRPGNAEVDVATHDPQAVDIARRGGRFAALPVLTTAGDAIPPAMLPQLMPEWADSALAHGASGLVFSSWSGLLANEPLRQAVGSTLARMDEWPRRALWSQSPVATTAIVLTPLADGYTRPGALPGQGRGLYGFGANMVAGEPNNLVYALRWGTLFGGVDYLSPDDVESGGATGALSHYSTILMPQALSVSNAMAAALESYVRGGGVLVADLGLGAMQAEAQSASVPPALAALFGIVPDMRLRALAFDLQLLYPHPLLPTWSRSAGGVNASGLAQQSVVLTGGSGPRGTAFAGPVGFPIAPSILPGTTPVALASQVPQQLGAGPTAHLHLERSTLTVHQHGRGFAVFAPFQMWPLWLPGQPGFDAFHGDLLARGAAIAQGSSSLVPAPATGEGMIYPETVNLPNGVLLLNHFAPPADTPMPDMPAPDTSQTRTNSIVVPSLSSSPPAATSKPSPTLPTVPAPVPNSLYSTVETMGVGQFLWRGGLCVFPAVGQSLPLSGARAAPVAGLAPEETQPQSVALHALVKPQQMSYFSLLPARAENLSGGPLSAYIALWTPRDAKFFLWPNSTTVIPAGDDVGVLVTSPSPVRLTLYDKDDPDGYRVLPLSRHRVQYADKSRGNVTPVSTIVQADADGRLVVNVSGAANYIEITPAN